jgi:outer membrane protein assembly factor BamB
LRPRRIRLGATTVRASSLSPFPLVLLVLPAIAGGCRCKRDVDQVRPEDDAITVVHDSSTPKKAPSDPRFEVVWGDVVDLESRTDATMFTPQPRRWASDADRLYVIDDASIAAYVPPSAGPRWETTVSLAVGRAMQIVVGDPWIVAAWENNVARFDRSNGTRALLLPGAGAPFTDVVLVRDAAFVIDASGNLSVVETSTATVRATLPPPKTPPWSGDLVAFDDLGIACRLTRDANWQVDCVEPSGAVRWTKSFVSPAGASPGCMQARTPSTHHLLFSGRWGGTCGTHVVRAKDGALVLDWIGDASAIVEDASGSFDGLLAIPSGGSTTGDVLFTDARGATRWTTKLGGYGEELNVVRRGDALIVARWELIATGSELVAFDARTGATIWNADVEQLGIPHSKYHNDVALRPRGDDLVLVGHESGGSYVQIFDASSGARRYAHLLK